MSRVGVEADSQFTRLLVQATQFLLTFVTQLTLCFELFFCQDGRNVLSVGAVLPAPLPVRAFTRITPGLSKSPGGRLGAPGGSRV